MPDPVDTVSAAAAARGEGKEAWQDVVPKAVGSEDALSVEDNKRVWEKMYKEAGLNQAGEKERRALRAAVYVYCCKNGTSREGDYAAGFVLSTGKEIPAAVIPRAAGKMRIRKFMRANMIESYNFFKATKVMEAEERFVSKCSTHGIAAECAFATADWLTDCPLFTPAEAKAHNAMFAYGVERARRNRGGDLEGVEQDRVKKDLEVQGAMPGGVVEL